MDNELLEQLDSSDSPAGESLIHYWELSNYNNGVCIGKWFDLDTMTHSDHQRDISDWLQELTDKTGILCEEIIVGDSEGVPKQYVGEWALDEEFFTNRDAMEDIDLDDAIIEAGIELGIPLESIQDAYCEKAEGSGDEIWTNFAEAVIDDSDLQGLPKHLQGYFDYKKYGRDLYQSHNEQDGYIFSSNY